MPHVFEPAATGRAKCRGCRQPLPKGELRFGEGLPNPFGDGEVMHWFHPLCAAYKRPEPLLEALPAAAAVSDAAELERVAREAIAHPKLQRIDGAEISPSGQARCRCCQEPIEKGTWRIRLMFQQEGTFSPGGFIHLQCRSKYFETSDVAAPLLQFSPGLDAPARADLLQALAV
jgi:hypothetical protein